MTRVTRPGMPPQRTVPRPVQRPGPYSVRDSANMATTMIPAMAAWPQPQTTSALTWSDHHLHDQHMQYAQQAMVPTYIQTVRAPSMATHPMHQEAIPRPGQSGPWSPEEDDVLVDAKSRGLAWDEIHRQYFPHKTGNACRKRHDRLLIKARDPTWDEARIQRVVACYNRFREQVWHSLADQVGERWEEVERVMFQQGLRGLRNTRPRHSRTRSQASSGQAGLSEYEHLGSTDEHENTDDSGISLGHGGHSRRPSMMDMSQQQDLPGVGYILSE